MTKYDNSLVYEFLNKRNDHWPLLHPSKNKQQCDICFKDIKKPHDAVTWQQL